MEVHPPHQPVHGWRDFAIHLIIVTIGLCIALSLEALVERVHHHHLVREARENIRKELNLNLTSAIHDRDLLKQNVAREDANIVAIHGLMTQGEKFQGQIDNTFDMDSLNDSAWHTARDTGALSYMPYDEVQRYSDLYSLQTFLDQQSESTAVRDFQAAAPLKMGYDIAALPASEYAWLLHENATIEILLKVEGQLTQQYIDLVSAELKSH